MHAGGRPTLRTPEVVYLICDALSHGLSNEDAAAIAGIGVRTLYDWLEDEEFLDTIRAAKAQQKLTLVKQLTTAEPGRWQQIAWRLERLDINFCRPEVRLQFLIHEGKKDTIDQPEQLLKDLALITSRKQLNG
jgi:hypothetical protein